jgi:hypothetical protein
LAEQTSTFAVLGFLPMRGARARNADDSPPVEAPRDLAVERSLALLRQVNELMREGRRGRTERELIPFFCECRRVDCCEPLWLTGDAYDERHTEAQPLVLPGHEHLGAEAKWQHAAR